MSNDYCHATIPSSTKSNDPLLLVGAGHAHLYLLKNGNKLNRYVSTILLDPGKFWYSGMATGMLAGYYSEEEDTLSPEKLAQNSGCTFIRDKVTRVDLDNKSVLTEAGHSLKFSALSFNTGSVVDCSEIKGCSEYALFVKPVSNLLELRHRLSLLKNSSPQVSVIGGGSTSVEVASCIRNFSNSSVRLITRSERLLPEMPLNASKAVALELSVCGVEVETSCSVNEVSKTEVITDRGCYKSDITVLATGLKAPEMFMGEPFSVSESPGLSVTSTLQSKNYPYIFGSGDCIDFEEMNLQKLGVHSVRQAPVLLNNLISFYSGGIMQKYHPPKNCLSILHLGNYRALAVYGNWWWCGRASFILKNYIDKRFMNSYRRA